MLAVLMVLASGPTPPDAPINEALEVRTAVVELLDHTFLAKGHGCYLPQQTCLNVGKELSGRRARDQVYEEGGTFTGYVVATVTGLVLGLAGGAYLMYRFCSAVPTACR